MIKGSERSTKRRRRTTTGDDQKKPTMSCSAFLPQDVLINEILMKLPVKSLLKLKCVSKCFKNLITCPTFVYQHLHHSTSQLNNHLVLLITSHFQSKTCNYCCKFSTDDHDPSHPHVVDMCCPLGYTTSWLVAYNIQASCNGLLCIGWGLYTRYIWNPCTKEYKEIPYPPLEKAVYQKYDHARTISCSKRGFCGFGYDRTNDEYKIMYYVSHKVDTYKMIDDSFVGSTFVTEFMLYTLGTHTWRSIHNDDDHHLYSSLRFGRWIHTGLFVNGALHWIMSSKDSSRCKDTKAMIISFDIEKEEFREIQKPQSILEEDEYYWNLQVLQGCLCMCQVLDGSGGIDIWMLKDYAAEDSWTKLFTVVESKLYSPKHFKLLRYCENGEILMTKNEYNLILYDPKNNKARHVENIEVREGYFLDQMIYTESLVSLNTGTYKDR